jgi:hypothetical protein
MTQQCQNAEERDPNFRRSENPERRDLATSHITIRHGLTDAEPHCRINTRRYPVHAPSFLNSAVAGKMKSTSSPFEVRKFI